MENYLSFHLEANKNVPINQFQKDVGARESMAELGGAETEGGAGKSMAELGGANPSEGKIGDDEGNQR